jgi:DNA repair photolyase
MKNTVVEIPSILKPIAASPGFAKKHLADHKLDILGLCGFGCRYCSSNWGNFLRIRRSDFLEYTRRQTGKNLTPDANPDLMFVWPDVFDRLHEQLAKKRDKTWGQGQTLVFSMLTDGFSPLLVVEKSAFRIRVLTKNAVVGTPEWIEFFRAHPDRFVVGLSTGTMSDTWAKKIELGTSSPSERLDALARLQEAGVPTFGMLCPVFPDVLAERGVEDLLDRVRPELTEAVWAEPYNDRVNWRTVRGGYRQGSEGHVFLTAVYEDDDKGRWSEYATDLYLRLRASAEDGGWLPKLRYLLYEDQITEQDARRLGDMRGVLLQSKPGADGQSRNPHIAQRQTG